MLTLNLGTQINAVMYIYILGVIMVFRLIGIDLYELKMRSAYIKWYLIWKTMCFQPIKVTKLVFELTSIPERETN